MTVCADTNQPVEIFSSSFQSGCYHSATEETEKTISS